MDVTGREEEEVIVALHDCDNDTNRAINMLLEGGNDQVRYSLNISLLHSLMFLERILPIPFKFVYFVIFIEGRMARNIQQEEEKTADRK